MSPRILVVGGVDPTGRAGLARDLDVAESERVEAAAIPSCLTVQNATRVHRVEPVSSSLLADLLEAASKGSAVDAIKVGLLSDGATTEVVRRFVRSARVPLILDPVLRARGGSSLTVEDTVPKLRELAAEATLVTPNLFELGALTGRPTSTRGERVEAARRLRKVGGAKQVLVKGGHGPENPGLDLLVGPLLREFRFERFDLSDAAVGRGKGCELASRVAALVAKGLSVEESVGRALRLLHERLQLEVDMSRLSRETALDVGVYTRTLESLLTQLKPACVPEVGINLAYAPSGCSNPQEAIGLAGRVTIAGDSFAVAGRPRPGGPHHTGRIAYAAQGRLKKPAWVFNHRYDPSLLEGLGAEHVHLRRQEEPPDAPSSMEWMIETAIAKHRRLPGYLSDQGAVGKEAMIRILGHAPEELLSRHAKLHAFQSVPRAPLEAVHS